MTTLISHIDAVHFGQNRSVPRLFYSQHSLQGRGGKMPPGETVTFRTVVLRFP
jgi:hypothetical protein